MLITEAVILKPVVYLIINLLISFHYYIYLIGICSLDTVVLAGTVVRGTSGCGASIPHWKW